MAVMIAGLAIGAVGSIASAQGQASAAKAQAQQAEVNRRWQEFETQYNLQQQRGTMGLSEMQRVLGQNRFQKESMAQMVAQQRAIRQNTEYQNTQYNRQYRTAEANRSMTMNSRGVGRGGTADALERQLNHTAAEDSLRIRQNGQNQLDAVASQRNAQLMEIFGKAQAPKPPTYFPSSPIPQPDTSGMMTGAVLGAIGGAIGAYGGKMMANRSTGATGGGGALEAPSASSYMESTFGGGNTYTPPVQTSALPPINTTPASPLLGATAALSALPF
jgi:hypothetical protein